MTELYKTNLIGDEANVTNTAVNRESENGKSKAWFSTELLNCLLDLRE